MFDIPLELFIGFIGIAIGLAVFGFIRQPQIPAMIAFGGIFILVVVVSTDNIIMGQLVESSANSGTTINYTYTPDNYEFTELPKTLFSLIGVIMMLCGGIMVLKQ